MSDCGSCTFCKNEVEKLWRKAHNELGADFCSAYKKRNSIVDYMSIDDIMEAVKNVCSRKV